MHIQELDALKSSPTASTATATATSRPGSLTNEPPPPPPPPCGGEARDQPKPPPQDPLGAPPDCPREETLTSKTETSPPAGKKVSS